MVSQKPPVISSSIWKVIRNNFSWAKWVGKRVFVVTGEDFLDYFLMNRKRDQVVPDIPIEGLFVSWVLPVFQAISVQLHQAWFHGWDNVYNELIIKGIAVVSDTVNRAPHLSYCLDQSQTTDDIANSNVWNVSDWIIIIMPWITFSNIGSVDFSSDITNKVFTL